MLLSYSPTEISIMIRSGITRCIEIQKRKHDILNIVTNCNLWTIFLNHMFLTYITFSMIRYYRVLLYAVIPKPVKRRISSTCNTKFTTTNKTSYYIYLWSTTWLSKKLKLTSLRRQYLSQYTWRGPYNVWLSWATHKHISFEIDLCGLKWNWYKQINLSAVSICYLINLSEDQHDQCFDNCLDIDLILAAFSTYVFHVGFNTTLITPTHFTF